QALPTLAARAVGPRGGVSTISSRTLIILNRALVVFFFPRHTYRLPSTFLSKTRRAHEFRRDPFYWASNANSAAESLADPRHAFADGAAPKTRFAMRSWFSRDAWVNSESQGPGVTPMPAIPSDRA